MNKVLLVGNLVKDVEVRYTTSDNAIARFTIAINREVKNKDGNYDADYINCVSFGERAKSLSQYLKKGTKVSVEGHIQTGSYEKDGKKVYTTDIVVEKIQFLDSKK